MIDCNVTVEDRETHLFVEVESVEIAGLKVTVEVPVEYLFEDRVDSLESFLEALLAGGALGTLADILESMIPDGSGDTND